MPAAWGRGTLQQHERERAAAWSNKKCDAAETAIVDARTTHLRLPLFIPLPTRAIVHDRTASRPFAANGSNRFFPHPSLARAPQVGWIACLCTHVCPGYILSHTLAPGPLRRPGLAVHPRTSVHCLAATKRGYDGCVGIIIDSPPMSITGWWRQPFCKHGQPDGKRQKGADDGAAGNGTRTAGASRVCLYSSRLQQLAWLTHVGSIRCKLKTSLTNTTCVRAGWSLRAFRKMNLCGCVMLHMQCIVVNGSTTPLQAVMNGNQTPVSVDITEEAMALGPEVCKTVPPTLVWMITGCVPPHRSCQMQ